MLYDEFYKLVREEEKKSKEETDIRIQKTMPDILHKIYFNAMKNGNFSDVFESLEHTERVLIIRALERIISKEDLSRISSEPYNDEHKELMGEVESRNKEINSYFSNECNKSKHYQI